MTLDEGRYMKAVMLKAWLLCAVLDALYAMAVTLFKSGDVVALWRRVASGPFGEKAMAGGPAWIGVGLVVHLTIMAIMVAAFVFAARQWPRLLRKQPMVVGSVYGLLLYLFMYHLVLPIRWPEVYPQLGPGQIAVGLLPHIIAVGIPLAWLARSGVTD
jgi:hypothetical protein